MPNIEPVSQPILNIVVSRAGIVERRVVAYLRAHRLHLQIVVSCHFRARVLTRGPGVRRE